MSSSVDSPSRKAVVPYDVSNAVISYTLFFFSSRRRHTRCGRDWSSDVCSSDLGATLALALARVVPELRVTVVESFPLSPDALPDDYQPSYDARSTALAWGSRLIFEELGLWAALSEHATPIRNIHVSDRGRFGATRLDAADHGQPALGYVADNRWMGLCLMRALLETPVSWPAPAGVVGMTPIPGGVKVSIRKEGEEQTLTGQCLVVADGGRSGLRDQLGFVT